MKILNDISTRESQVLQLIAQEFTSKEIAQKLFISVHTAHSHRKNLIDKLGVKNTAGLVRVGYEKGLLSLCLFLFMLPLMTSAQILAEYDGAIKIGGTATEDTGAIRWNEATMDFEGYNGSEWVSFTKAEILNFNNEDTTSILPFCADTVISELSGIQTHFGHAVDLYNNFGVVRRSDFPDLAVVYQFQNNSWSIDSVLSINFNSSSINDQILLHDSTLVVGASGSNTTGEISIWSKQPSAMWTSDTLFGETGSTRFGSSIAFNGKFLVVGADATEVNASLNEGEIFIYKKVNGLWTTVANFENPDVPHDSGFGSAVSLSNNFILVSSANHIYVYAITGELIQFHSKIEDILAVSIDYDGQFFAVGNPFFTDGFSQQGKVTLFNSSSLAPTDTLMIEEANHHLGSEISLDGDYMLVTAREAQDNGNGKPGRVYVYYFNGSSWENVETLTDPIIENDAQFGHSTGLHGSNYIIGVPRADVNNVSDEGKVFFGTIK